jgi:hypothetical protein
MTILGRILKMNRKYVILIPLILATFIHLINPVGFPDIFFDEGIYMRRAMNMIETGNPHLSQAKNLSTTYLVLL